MAGATWNCCQLCKRSVDAIPPCTCLQFHFIQSHIRRMHECFTVTCHLHFWQNDWDLVHAATTHNTHASTHMHPHNTHKPWWLPTGVTHTQRNTHKSRWPPTCVEFWTEPHRRHMCAVGCPPCEPVGGAVNWSSPWNSTDICRTWNRCWNIRERAVTHDWHPWNRCWNIRERAVTHDWHPWNRCWNIRERAVTHDWHPWNRCWNIRERTVTHDWHPWNRCWNIRERAVTHD